MMLYMEIRVQSFTFTASPYKYGTRLIDKTLYFIIFEQVMNSYEIVHSAYIVYSVTPAVASGGHACSFMVVRGHSLLCVVVRLLDRPSGGRKIRTFSGVKPLPVPSIL